MAEIKRKSVAMSVLSDLKEAVAFVIHIHIAIPEAEDQIIGAIFYRICYPFQGPAV